MEEDVELDIAILELFGVQLGLMVLSAAQLAQVSERLAQRVAAGDSKALVLLAQLQRFGEPPQEP